MLLLQKNKYINVDEILFTDVKSFDDKDYVCEICHFKILKGKIPCQAVYNNIYNIYIYIYIYIYILTKYQLNLHL